MPSPSQREQAVAALVAEVEEAMDDDPYVPDDADLTDFVLGTRVVRAKEAALRNLVPKVKAELVRKYGETPPSSPLPSPPPSPSPSPPPSPPTQAERIEQHVHRIADEMREKTQDVTLPSKEKVAKRVGNDRVFAKWSEAGQERITGRVYSELEKSKLVTPDDLKPEELNNMIEERRVDKQKLATKLDSTDDAMRALFTLSWENFKLNFRERFNDKLTTLIDVFKSIIHGVIGVARQGMAQLRELKKAGGWTGTIAGGTVYILELVARTGKSAWDFVSRVLSTVGDTLKFASGAAKDAWESLSAAAGDTLVGKAVLAVFGMFTRTMFWAYDLYVRNPKEALLMFRVLQTLRNEVCFELFNALGLSEIVYGDLSEVIGDHVSDFADVAQKMGTFVMRKFTTEGGGFDRLYDKFAGQSTTLLKEAVKGIPFVGNLLGASIGIVSDMVQETTRETLHIQFAAREFRNVFWGVFDLFNITSCWSARKKKQLALLHKGEQTDALIKMLSQAGWNVAAVPEKDKAKLRTLAEFESHGETAEDDDEERLASLPTYYDGGMFQTTPRFHDDQISRHNQIIGETERDAQNLLDEARKIDKDIDEAKATPHGHSMGGMGAYDALKDIRRLEKLAVEKRSEASTLLNTVIPNMRRTGPFVPRANEDTPYVFGGTQTSVTPIPHMSALDRAAVPYEEQAAKLYERAQRLRRHVAGIPEDKLWMREKTIADAEDSEAQARTILLHAADIRAGRVYGSAPLSGIDPSIFIPPPSPSPTAT